MNCQLPNKSLVFLELKYIYICMCLPGIFYINLPETSKIQHISNHNIYFSIYIFYNYIQMVPNLWWFDLRFFSFMMVWNQYKVSRNCTSDFEFWSFPIIICVLLLLIMIFSHGARRWQWTELLVSHVIRSMNSQ